MAIPGLKPRFDVKAKVRIGIKKKSQGGKEFPASVDYFVCDDPEFVQLCGDQPKSIRIRFPFQHAADNFSTGLEWWRGKQLTCYSKGEPADAPLAYRVEDQLTADTPPVGEKMGRDRLPIRCAFRDCPIFKKKDCRPLGRLQFFLDGGKTDAVYQLDTKSWNSIEGIEAVFSTLGDPRGRVFNLVVEIVQKGRDKFPVLSITEADVQINTPADVAKADALVQLLGAIGRDEPEATLKLFLAQALDQTNPGWRENEALIARIQDIGVRAAAEGLIARNP